LKIPQIAGGISRFGKVEVSLRRDREKRMVLPAEAVGKVMELLAG
jgi:hypothetical protein